MSDLKILLVIPYFERPKMVLSGLRAMEKSTIIITKYA